MAEIPEDKQSLVPLQFTPSDSTAHEKLKNQIEDWFKDEEIPFEERSTPSQVSYFQLKAIVQDFPIFVQELNQKRGCLLVHSFLVLNAAQLSQITNKSTGEKEAIRKSILSFLDEREFSFRVDENYESKHWIMIQRILYVENLTREKLMGEVKDLRIKFRLLQKLIDNSLPAS